ncbi:FHA domain-containing protein [Pseudokineococcus basanitobsidens]|uniref:FHA domain-containing protein n=1 Tax=Pseudokineococcus basanitobsidens TaxID=1926649 RepID=A0ABU8RJ09_9ACTN
MSTQDPGPRDPADTSTSGHGLPDLASTSEQAPAPADEAVVPALSGDEREAVSSLPTGSALLVVQRGPNHGARFLLDAGRTSAGRHPDSDIFLDDVTVSRRHAEFLREGSGEATRFLVRDAGSLNGTYVNRDRVDEVELSAGDEVQVGKYRLVFHPSGEVAGGADAPGPA